jgi:hypothetical protein
MHTYVHMPRTPISGFVLGPSVGQRSFPSQCLTSHNTYPPGHWHGFQCDTSTTHLFGNRYRVTIVSIHYQSILVWSMDEVLKVDVNVDTLTSC